MDVDEEWEVLPEDGFLEINDDGSGKSIFSRKYNNTDDAHFNMNYTYFVCPPPKPYSSQFVDPTPTKPSHVAETLVQDKISQVCFKKMNDHHHHQAAAAENMKMDSPANMTTVVVPQTDDDDDDVGGEEFEDTKDVVVSSSPGRADHQENGEGGGGGFSLWQWSLSGIGAICSFGVAAATTICIVFIENQQKHKRHHQNHNIRFQIYTHHDKRIKEVVEHASKLKEAISTARGVPFTRAHITFGGYCDAF
nr:Titin like [Ipomoea batatas]